ncbi:MAG: carboxypeptidase-like regulatory domain-containing protein [Flavobacterium sp.]|uniref:carboxypeptidase-like regulatory domain-containing protein n=1 Tax=Flavobacterium sp. TaxID=239 RepID=UPI0022BFC684|nr:carboxypeptidase-like regulatory domain-containing protein [Flavobacterium sp.]MCZ8197027.1 carboxypeptidase-like regulatory domain-containing protein [Flavobacterium sp.]
MASKTKITIPKPCQENWLEMTPLEQGRFCQLCQKNVFDFTTASDREILVAYNKDQQLCGRFTTSQLNRDLHIRKEKSSIWVAATSAIVSFLGLGTNEVQSQETIKVEQTDKKVLTDSIENSDEIEKLINGIVYDETGLVLLNAKVSLKSSLRSVQTDFDGKFSILARKNDYLLISYNGYETSEIIITKSNNYICKMKLSIDSEKLYQTIVTGGICKKRTFFGRMFHSIGNWFR